MSTAGGMPNAVDRADALACDAYQIFVKSPNRWASKAFPATEIAAFRTSSARHGGPVVAHAGYLINLASPKVEVREKSHAALLDELRRCASLGVVGLVMHPGAPQEDGRDVGIDRVARALDEILTALAADHGGASPVRMLLENTAGQGSTLGLTIDELQSIRVQMDRHDEVGICLDTCHAFAAGYDVTNADGYDRLIDEVGAGPGLDAVGCWHLNDSKFPLGGRRDRHENLGVGEIGMDAFVRVATDPRWAEVPGILETPLGDDDLGHERDLVALRAALGR